MLQWPKETTNLNIVPGIPGLDNSGSRVGFNVIVEFLSLYERFKEGIPGPDWQNSQPVDCSLINQFPRSLVVAHKLVVGHRGLESDIFKQ
jgi:hypothetical protein